MNKLPNGEGFVDRNLILAFVETRAGAIFGTKHFLELSESMVQLILNRNIEVPEIVK